MKSKILAMTSCILLNATTANAESPQANILGIDPSIESSKFKDFVTENLADFRGGWACATIKTTHSCYSHMSDIRVLDKTDDSLSLIVQDDMQILVASCGVFDACDGFSMETLLPAIKAGQINFPTAQAKMIQRSPDTIIENEDGVFMVDVSDGYIKMSAKR